MKKKPLNTNIESFKNDLSLLSDDTYLVIRNLDGKELIIDEAKIPFIGNVCMTLDNAYKLYFSIDELFNRDVIIPEDMLYYYVNLFLSAKSFVEYTNIKLFANHQFKEGSRIEFLPDKAGRVKIGIIDSINKDYCGIYYRILKKDGTLGKKELVLYEDSKYKLLDREYINYKKIMNPNS